MRRASSVGWCLVMWMLTACGDDDGGARDAATDAALDAQATHDANVDAMAMDATTDATTSSDAGLDANLEDAGLDANLEDAGLDAMSAADAGDDAMAEQQSTAYLKARNAGNNDQFGFRVAIAGDIIVVGTPEEDGAATGINRDNNNNASGSGAAYVYERSGGSWRQVAYVKASNAWNSDGFGYSVAASGNTIVVGAPYEDSGATGVNGNYFDDSVLGSGAAYVFVRDDNGEWTQEAYLKASNTGTSDYFGASVAITGDTIVVGATLEDSSATGFNGDQADNAISNSGAAYVFVRSNGNWTQQAYLKASNPGVEDHFGHSLALSGDTLVVGAVQESSASTGVNADQANDDLAGAGAAYVFVRSGNNWSQQAYLKASNTGAGDAFGDSVAIAGDTIAVGAFGEDSAATGVDGADDNSGIDNGAVYVFARSGGNWSQQAYLKASNSQGLDHFGKSVALAADTLLVGTPNEDSNAIGFDGAEDNDSAFNSGAAYVFTRDLGVWSQALYVKASNTGAGDNFGTSVAAFERTWVIGAIGESSRYGTVDGDQSNNDSPAAGAAYVFRNVLP